MHVWNGKAYNPINIKVLPRNKLINLYTKVNEFGDVGLEVQAEGADEEQAKRTIRVREKNVLERRHGTPLDESPKGTDIVAIKFLGGF